jgi:hypothetical protein
MILFLEVIVLSRVARWWQPRFGFEDSHRACARLDVLMGVARVQLHCVLHGNSAAFSLYEIKRYNRHGS